MFDTVYPCPDCGSATVWELDCPGYVRNGKLMVCVPACGNAFLLSCTGCSWELRVPENRRGGGRGTVPAWLVLFLAEFKERDDEDD